MIPPQANQSRLKPHSTAPARASLTAPFTRLSSPRYSPPIVLTDYTFLAQFATSCPPLHDVSFRAPASNLIIPDLFVRRHTVCYRPNSRGGFMEPAISSVRPSASSRLVACLWCHEATTQADVDAQSRPLPQLRSRQHRDQLAPGLRPRSQHRLDSFQSSTRVRLMNAALQPDARARSRSFAAPPRFNPFAAVMRTDSFTIRSAIRSVATPPTS